MTRFYVESDCEWTVVEANDKEDAKRRFIESEPEGEYEEGDITEVCTSEEFMANYIELNRDDLEHEYHKDIGEVESRLIEHWCERLSDEHGIKDGAVSMALIALIDELASQYGKTETV